MKDKANFLYYLKKDTAKNSVYVCNKYKKKSNCPVTATINKSEGSITYSYDHNHSTVETKTKLLAKDVITNAVKNSDIKTRKVFSDITTKVQNTPGTSMGSIAKKESSIRSIRYHKQKFDGKPADPKVASDIMNMPDKFRLTCDETMFLQDAGLINGDEKNVYLVYMSDYGKHLLSTYTSWSGDGTFSTIPKIFKQIYFLGCSYRFILLHLCYCLVKVKRCTV